MAYYIKVTQRVAEVLGVQSDRNNTADNNVLLWQADLNSVEGDTLLDKVAEVGGAALSPQQAKAETEGVDNPVEVTTPDEYKENLTVPDEVEEDTHNEEEVTE